METDNNVAKAWVGVRASYRVAKGWEMGDSCNSVNNKKLKLYV